jgi:hypothetical protein
VSSGDECGEKEKRHYTVFPENVKAKKKKAFE